MDSVVKTVQEVKNIVMKPVSPKSPIATGQDTVNHEIYHYFNIPTTEGNRDQLKVISDWAMESGDVGKALKKIRRLEDSLGEPSVGETRMSKLYNWIRMSTNIKELQGEMQGELDKINSKLKTDLLALKDNYGEKIKRLDAEIKTLESAYRQALKDYRINATNRAKKVSENYADRLRELKDMRSAFKGGK